MTGHTDALNRQQERVAAYFGRQSAYWHDLYASEDLQAITLRERHAAVLDMINALPLASEAQALEVGCGGGFLSAELARLGLRVHAIDAAPEMIEQTRKQAAESGVAGRLAVAVGDAQTLSFPDATFDLVVAIGVIPWLDLPDQAVREMARVTRPGGYVVVSTANWFGLISQLDPMNNPALAPLKRWAKAMLARSGHPRPLPSKVYHSDRVMEATLARAGLVTMQRRALGFGPFTMLHRRIVPDPLGKALHRRLQLLADRGAPGVRSVGATSLFATRKPLASS